MKVPKMIMAPPSMVQILTWTCLKKIKAKMEAKTGYDISKNPVSVAFLRDIENMLLQLAMMHMNDKASNTNISFFGSPRSVEISAENCGRNSTVSTMLDKACVPARRNGPENCFSKYSARG